MQVFPLSRKSKGKYPDSPAGVLVLPFVFIIVHVLVHVRFLNLAVVIVSAVVLVLLFVLFLVVIAFTYSGRKTGIAMDRNRQHGKAQVPARRVCSKAGERALQGGNEESRG